MLDSFRFIINLLICFILRYDLKILRYLLTIFKIFGNVFLLFIYISVLLNDIIFLYVYNEKKIGKSNFVKKCNF